MSQTNPKKPIKVSGNKNVDKGTSTKNTLINCATAIKMDNTCDRIGVFKDRSTRIPTDKDVCKCETKARKSISNLADNFINAIKPKTSAMTENKEKTKKDLDKDMDKKNEKVKSDDECESKADKRRKSIKNLANNVFQAITPCVTSKQKPTEENAEPPKQRKSLSDIAKSVRKAVEPLLAAPQSDPDEYRKRIYHYYQNTCVVPHHEARPKSSTSITKSLIDFHKRRMAGAKLAKKWSKGK